MRVALVCIARDEDHYINEWVSYHKKLGFDAIFIYEHYWKCNIVDDIVKTVPWDKPITTSLQAETYNHFIKNNHKEYDWAVIIDVDEFLVLHKHKNVQQFISDYNKGYPAIAIMTYLFGSNGLKQVENDNYSVLERFTKRRNTYTKNENPPWFVKCIVRLSDTMAMACAHHPYRTASIDTNGEASYSAIRYGKYGVNDIAQVNHYFVKSEQEFSEKIQRGRISGQVKRTMDEFYHHDLNEVEDLTALKFYRGDYEI